MTRFPQIKPDLAIPDSAFPDSDGKPMADNTEQFRWIVMLKENLEILFADDPQVFVAGDLLWYPVRSHIVPPVASDAMVVFGRPKGKRGSYKQWQEDDIPPQVVFEIRSPGNSDDELARKLEFYDTHGVEEYYLYDPDGLELQGWLRQEWLVPIEAIENWTSPRLGIRLTMETGELVVYRPDGRRFLSSVELFQCAEQERQRADRLAEYLRNLGIDPDNLP